MEVDMITADKVLSEQQIKKLVSRLEIEKNKALHQIKSTPQKTCPGEIRIVQDYFLFTLISMTGLRVSEAIRLETVDVGPDYIIIRAEYSKNKKKGVVYYGDRTRSLIYDLFDFYTDHLSRYKSEYLFPSHSKQGHLNRSYAHRRFKFWLNIVKLPSHFSIHSLRHSYATICLDKGLQLTFVRDQLRHSSISVSSQYLHLTRENREKVKGIF